MSNDYINGVIAHSQSRRSARAVLIAIANRAQADGISFPSHATIAAEAGISERTVTRAIVELVRLGEIKVLNEEKQHQSPQYRILLRPEKSAQSRHPVIQGRQNGYAEPAQGRQIDARVDILSSRVDKLSEDYYTRDLNPMEPNGTQGEGAPATPPNILLPQRQLHSQQRGPMERNAEAKALGLEPEQFTELTDILLEVTGKAALANSNSGIGDKILCEAQEAVLILTGPTLGYGSPPGIRQVAQSFRQTHPRHTTPPTFGQLLEHASELAGGKVNGTLMATSGKAASEAASGNGGGLRRDAADIPGGTGISRPAGSPFVKPDPATDLGLLALASRERQKAARNAAH